MIPLLVLWLGCIHLTNQEICSSPGNLPAPQLLVDKASSEEGDAMVLKCKVPALSPFSRVIFCKDGKDLASLPMQESKFAYEYNVRANTAGTFTCLYQHKDHQNQENNSLLSGTQNLELAEAVPTSSTTVSGVQLFSNGSSSNLIIGITIPSLLVLVVVCSVLVKKVLRRWTDNREHSPSKKSTETPEDQLEYAMIAGFGRARPECSKASRNMEVTYATVAHCTAKAAGKTEDGLCPYGTGLGF